MEFALVTGASRGVGRGVASELAAQGFGVFASGRRVGAADLPSAVVRGECDHTVEGDVERLFEYIGERCNGLEVVVNSAWGGYERMVEGGQFTWGLPFWRQPAHRWTG